ncbi:MAG: trimethylamine--corrinoid methyltransferase [Desulfobacterales bacterium]|nr:trimethylamine--corrinoid methyltransferase [Desulfobacterales bacterium]
MNKAQELFESAISVENTFEFEKAKGMYAQIATEFPGSGQADKAAEKMEDMDLLIQEKNIYKRINQAAKDVLTKIGINIAESERIMEIMMNADAIDFDNEEAIFVPLKPDYIERCLEQVPRSFGGDPGKNAFGTGATPPFLKRETDDELRPANGLEFKEIVDAVAENADIVDIFSVPVQTDKQTSDFECAKMMDQGFSGLKMISTKKMSDEEVSFFRGREDWLDGTTLITSLGPMNTMVEPFIRSAEAGNNLLLLDLSIAGFSAPHSPESLLTLIHAQEIFMMVLAQTINPGITCVHGGIPGITDSSGDLSYTSLSQSLTNASMARLNTWITGIPSAQSGGSTSVTDDLKTAVEESEFSRNMLRKYGVHIVRHALGALGSLTFFSLPKFREDCKREAAARKEFVRSGVAPLYIPADPDAFQGIREMAEKGNPRSTDHALYNVKSFMDWEERIGQEAARKDCLCLKAA